MALDPADVDRRIAELDARLAEAEGAELRSVRAATDSAKHTWRSRASASPESRGAWDGWPVVTPPA